MYKRLVNFESHQERIQHICCYVDKKYRCLNSSLEIPLNTSLKLSYSSPLVMILRTPLYNSLSIIIYWSYNILRTD